MNEKLLPIAAPPTYGYLCNAYPLSIALQNSNAEAWFYSNYIQLICSGNFPDGKFFTFYNSYLEWNEFFLSCPYLNYQKIHYSFVENYNGGLLGLICKSIDREGYVIIYVDEYYITHKSAYKEFFLPHEMLVYGYSDNKFHVLGYDKHGQFGNYEVEFEEINIAFHMCDKSVDFREYIYILEFNKNFEYKFDIKLVIQWLREFRYSVNSSIQFRAIKSPNDWWIYGISIYQHILGYLYKMLDIKKKIDVRLFHTLWEHKSIMLLRIKYIESLNNINDLDETFDMYTKIERTALIIRNLVIKYNVTKTDTTLSSIIKKMIELEELEIVALDNMIDILENIQ